MKKFYTFFIIFFTCSCWFNVAFAQEVVIVRVPDAALSTALRKALGLAPTALITKQAMSRLTTLHAAGDQQGEPPISDLTGLEHAAQLEILRLYWNQHISDLSPIAGLKQLRELHLGANQIRDLSPIAGLTQLETLYISNNQIRGVNPPVGLVNLKKLVIAGNPVRDASLLANLTKLVEVDIEIPHQVRAGGVISDRHLASAVRAALRLTNIQPIT